MSYEKGYFAFFDGSSSEYRRALQTSDTIAGFTVATVSPQQVMLQSTNHGDIALPLGMQLQRFDEGKWELAPRVDSSSTGRPSSSSNSMSSGLAGTASGEGGEEVLKRLMQQREQEGAVNPPPPNYDPPPVSLSPSADDNEVVRRLMQRRQQEIDK